MRQRPVRPERRGKSTTSTEGSVQVKPLYLVLVVTGDPSNDMKVWGLRAQQQANLQTAIFRVMGPAAGETEAQQPEIVRRALADGASGILIYPGKSPDLPRALADAERKGVPVVLIGGDLAAPEGSNPFITVDYSSFGPSAKEIVAATIEDLKKAHRPIDGTALVLEDKVTDASSARRAAALRSAAGSAKFRQVVTVSFESSTTESAKLAVLESIKAHPDVSVVLADDAEGITGAADARIESKGKPIFFVGGYVGFRTSLVSLEPSRESCFVEGNYADLGARAVLVALARVQRRPIGDLDRLPPASTGAKVASLPSRKPQSQSPHQSRARLPLPRHCSPGKPRRLTSLSDRSKLLGSDALGRSPGTSPLG